MSTASPSRTRVAEAKPEMAIAMVLSLCNAVRDDRSPGDSEPVATWYSSG